MFASLPPMPLRRSSCHSFVFGVGNIGSLLWLPVWILGYL
jgi:hypothetical protein